MIGAPPPDTSEHTQGRRLFLEASRGEDRMGPMRQAKKDTQTSVGAEDVPTDRKGKQSIRTRSLSVDSNGEDEDVTSSEDESLCHGDGSPILSKKTRRTGAARNSKPFQKTSNANEPRSPITSKIVFLAIYFSVIHIFCSVSVAKENPDNSLESCTI